jgi:hypothetical protein
VKWVRLGAEDEGGLVRRSEGTSIWSGTIDCKKPFFKYFYMVFIMGHNKTSLWQPQELDVRPCNGLLDWFSKASDRERVISRDLPFLSCRPVGDLPLVERICLGR